MKTPLLKSLLLVVLATFMGLGLSACSTPDLVEPDDGLVDSLTEQPEVTLPSEDVEPRYEYSPSTPPVKVDEDSDES